MNFNEKGGFSREKPPFCTLELHRFVQHSALHWPPQGAEMGPFPGGSPSVGMKVFGIYWNFVERLHLCFNAGKKMGDNGALSDCGRGRK